MRVKQKVALTDAFVQRVSPKPQTFLVWDAKQPRLALRVYPSGRKSFWFIYAARGRGPTWYLISDDDGIGIDNARRLALKLSVALAEGRDPAAERKAQRGGDSLAELHARYVEKRAQKNKSWRQAARLIERHVLPRLGRSNAKSITRADVRATLERITAPILFNQVLASLSALLSWAVKMDVLPHNVCKGIERNPTRSRERVLSDSELALFWPHLTPPLRVILLTGQRPGEVEHLLHLHIKDGWWEMPGAPDPKTRWPGTKNGEFHRVWLSEPVREIINRVSLEPGFVDKSVPLGQIYVFKRGHLDAVMRAVCAKLGVEDKVTPHDLRRTWTTVAAGLGVDHKALDRILNHADRSVTRKHYNQYTYAREDAAAMERVARHIIDVAEGRQVTADVIHVFDLIKKS